MKRVSLAAAALVMRLLAILGLGLTVAGCDVAINEGISLGGQILVEAIGGAIRGSGTAVRPSDVGKSVLVCNPVGEKVVDPTRECHAETQ